MKREGNKMDFINPVKDFIIENFLFGEAGDLTTDTSFLEGGIVDSTGILELVAFREENYRITVEDDELVPENFNSISDVSRFLKTKLVHE